ncbi:DUF1990 domain-containing protein [Actinotalea sp. K2]|uniref:DUF1990 family protein n=1 Tax=Actinotalea sp. K2 TaxID=2939438 RepID=UPI002017EE91|nr:DUF1990 domain-containing protein [Actinotalea sp. K2]MCL3860330.1 DUF1990 domain-containing protein [Actinotalea sp. K2]
MSTHPDLPGTGLTYSEVGATHGPLPAGYRHLVRSRTIGRGEDDFARAAEQLMTWQGHRGAGARVAQQTPPAAEGVEVEVWFGRGPLRVTAPCRVVYTVQEPTARGFAYGTLPGHPLRGEERFVVRRQADGTVVMEITAFSRPCTWWSRAGAPLVVVFQRLFTHRYLRALLT